MNEGSRFEREQFRWDDEARAYHELQKSKFGSLYSQVINRTLKNLTEEQNVVEIGCGSGLVTFGIASSVQSIKAYDISENMLRVARQDALKQSSDNIEFLQGDAYHLPDSERSFDVALCFYILDIVEQPEAILGEAYRILKKNGIVISVTDCYQDRSRISSPRLIAREVRRSIRKFMRKAKLVQHNEQPLRDSEIIRLTNDAGFRVIESELIDTGEPNQFNLYLKAKKI